MIKQDTIERIRVETDIVELVGGYLPLKKVGRNFRGVCPFHPDRSPSFYVNPERQTYHCFGCSAGGNAFSFIMEREKLAFPEAVRFLGERLGIKVSDDQPDRNQGLYEACDRAARFYEQQLLGSEEALRYLVKRRITPDIVKQYRLGYAPGGNRLRGEIKRQGWNIEDFQQAALVVDRGRGHTDYFFDRLMFPIFSPGGRVIGFGGRVLDDREPKYLNSPETAVFRKGEGLYGLFQAKAYLRDQPALLVEGNFDLLALAGCGFMNAVAPLGTALTPGQASLIRRYTGNVMVCFDGDEAGQKAARRSLEPLLKVGLDPLLVRLPEGVDPDDIARDSGRVGLEAILGQAVDFIGFLTGGKVPDAVADQRKLLGELAALIETIPDPATRQLYANRVAGMFRVDKRLLMRQERTGQGPAKAPAKCRELEDRLVAAVVHDPGLARVASEFGLEDLLEEEELRDIVRVAVSHCEDAGYGPAMILDCFECDKKRRRIAGWSMSESSLPSSGEFRARIQRLRAARLQREIIKASEQQQAERLIVERATLLQRAARKGDEINDQ